MKRLWVRLSLMIGGVLFLVFFLQFLSIIASDDGPPGTREPPGLESGQIPQDGDGPGNETDAEIARRLINFAAFSLLVGLGAGVLIARVVTRPIDEMTGAAQQLGEGNLAVRVQPRGSQEMFGLATAFNRMADDLSKAETLRTNLMADVSHELRTPLTVLEGNLRAALDHVYELNDVEIAGLYSQTRHLIRLVGDLHLLAQAEARRMPLERETINLNALVAETIQALDPLAAERGLVLVDETSNLPLVMLDAGRIRQVVFNLLFNAMRHTPAGGVVAIGSSASEAEVQLIVSDTGAGLEPIELAAVFDRFYRSDQSRQRDTGGTGLGLAIVKAIVEAHGGAVWAESEGKSHGSRFTVQLPATPA